MNKTLQKKLLSYSTLATALLAVDKSADAQIVYHQADTIIPTYGFNYLDLNADGIYDYNFYYYVSANKISYQTTFIWPNLNIYALNSDGLYFYWPIKDTIVKSTLANEVKAHLSSQMFYDYEFAALKLKSHGNTYMGWVRLGFGYDSVIIEDYAYNLNPSDSIILGDIGCKYTPATPIISLKSGDTLTSTPSAQYQWYLNGTIISGDTSQSFLPSKYGVYSVITTDTGNCKTQSSAVNFTGCDSMKIQISSNSYQACDSFYVVMQIENIPYGYNNIQWYDDGLPLWANNRLTPYSAAFEFYSHEDTTTIDTFYVIAYNPLMECYDTSNAVYYTMYSTPPIPVITQMGDTLIANDSIKGNYKYYWYENGGYKTVTVTNYYIPNGSGSFSVEVGIFEACTSTSAPYQYISSGINVLSSNDIIKVYTNDDNIYINFSSHDFLNGTIELYNIEGQKLQQQTITNTTEILNAQQYAKGIYFVSVSKNGVRKIYKVALL